MLPPYVERHLGQIMATPSDDPLTKRIREIHRRGLWQVLGIYLLGSWFVYQVVQSLTEGLGLPDWFPAFAVVFLLLGFPVVLATAFVQEGGPGHHAEDAPREAPAEGEPAVQPTVPSRLLTWRNALLGGLSALALVGAAALGSIFFGGGTSSGAEAPTSIEQSVAVIPFVNMSGDPDNEYFSDGITEELLNALAQLPGLRVPGRTSSFAFKGQNITIRQIADTLDVAHVLEGSVRRDEDRVLITAQLVEAETDTHLWSDTFERELEDIFAIQREIATAIVDQLQIALSGDQEARLVAEGTESPEAHEAYLRGRYLWNQRTAQSLGASIEQFQQAIGLDSDYGEAYAALAESSLLLEFYTPEGTLRAVYDQALAAARRAVDLAPGLGMAHTSLGMVLLRSGEWESAEQEHERAIEPSPGYATGHQRYAAFLPWHWKARRGSHRGPGGSRAGSRVVSCPF